MIRNRESEHAPLSAWDEYPIHQTCAPLRVVDTSDPRAYERYWFSVQDRGGGFLLQTGIGMYPNLGTVDAYVVWNHAHQHTTVRAHRYLNETRHRIDCGPFGFEVVEPFREWRLSLAPNAHDVAFDLRFRDTKRAMFHTIQPGGVAGTSGRAALRSCGYETFGAISGEVQVDGIRFLLDASQTCGSRDHHWGERNGVGGPAHLQRFGRSSHFGQWVEFADWGLWGPRVLFNHGDERRPVSVMRAEHALAFDPDTDHFIGGTVTNHLADGQTKVITYRQIEDKVAYLRTAMYMGPDYLGSPDEGLMHGMDVGGDRVSRVSYDLTQAKTRIRLGGFDDHLVQAECDGERSVGLIEVMNPVPYEWACRGVRGYRLFAPHRAAAGRDDPE